MSDLQDIVDDFNRTVGNVNGLYSSIQRWVLGSRNALKPSRDLCELAQYAG